MFNFYFNLSGGLGSIPEWISALVAVVSVPLIYNTFREQQKINKLENIRFLMDFLPELRLDGLPQISRGPLTTDMVFRLRVNKNPLNDLSYSFNKREKVAIRTSIDDASDFFHVNDSFTFHVTYSSSDGMIQVTEERSRSSIFLKYRNNNVSYKQEIIIVNMLNVKIRPAEIDI